jgi:hypothetical protein
VRGCGSGPGVIGEELRRSVMRWWNGMVVALRRSPARARGRSWRARRESLGSKVASLCA